jgi:5-methylcytosine-specific restriction protein B
MMHSALRIQDYIFDTVALRNAFETIDIREIPYDPDYTADAVYALFDYFCDWSPAREEDITNRPSKSLDNITSSEREAQFNECCDHLADNLQEQYSIQASQEDVVRLARLLGEDGPDLGQHDFVLRYLWRYSTHLGELDPDQNAEISTIQDLLNVTRNLPEEFRQAEQDRYSEGPVNKIRSRLLEQFYSDGEIELEVLENIKNTITEERDTALASWNNYRIVGQIYYDYFKPRLDTYLQTIADQILSAFPDLSLTTHIVNFQGARNFVSDFAWIAAYPDSNASQKDSYQLYLGIKADSLRYGLYVGDDLREGDWKSDRAVDTFERGGTIELATVIAKLKDVEEDFRRLENLGTDNPLGEPPFEKPNERTRDEIIRQLHAKNQVIFYGPPGTGKTHIASEFAKWWVTEQTDGTPEAMQVQSVTFHPAFAYEDFLEGLKADATDTGAVDYDIEDGILKRIARQARQAKDDADGNPPPYILIIDEINRGNLAQIFGETITLLEADKRDSHTTQLAHSDDEFSIPSNLYVIGTMNTADRSIALVDAALRRRFRFLHFPPDYGVLLKKHNFDDWTALDTAITDADDPFRTLLALSIRALQHINEQIVDVPDLSKGQQIGHSYLYDVEKSQEILDAWRFDILPLLEEYYFGQFDRIRRQLFGGAGDGVIDWDAERIRPFTEEDLATFLGQFVDTDVTYTPTTSTTDGGSTSTQSGTPTYPELLSEVHEEVLDRVGELLEANTVEETNYNSDLDRTTLALQSHHPEHPSGGALRYAFQPKTHLDDPRILIGVYATEEFRDAVDIDFHQILADSNLSDRFEYADKTYSTIEATWPVEIDAEDPDSLDGQALREAIGEQTLQDVIDAFVDLIETIHPAVVEAETPTQ